MRIGIFTNNYLPRVTGVAHTIEGFKEGLEKRGHQVFIFAPKYHSEHAEENVFRFRSLRIPPEFGNPDYVIPPVPVTRSPRIKDKIEKLELDLIHSHQPYLLGKSARRYAENFNLPLVFTPHTPYHEYFDSLPVGLDEVMKNLFFYLLSDYSKWSAAITVPTESMKDLFVRIDSEAKVDVIPSGLRIDFFEKKRPQKKVRKKYGISEKEWLLLTVARLSYEKNVDFLLEVLEYLKAAEKSLNLRLMIVGEGPKRRSLEKLAHSLGVEDGVIFTGQIEYKKLPCYYKSSDLFVYPSKVDSQGLVIREAQLSKLPVLAVRDCRGPREIIKHEKSGILVSRDVEKFAKAVLKLIRNSNLRQSLASEGHQEARELSIENVAERLEGVYKKVLAGRCIL